MDTSILHVAFFAGGILITLLIMYFTFRRKSLKEFKVKGSMEEIQKRVEAEIEAAGWKFLGKHAIHENLQKAGFESDKAIIYEICKPAYAYEVLKDDNQKKVSSMMPCRISLYQKSNGECYMSVMNASMMSKFMSGNVPSVLSKASKESEAIIEKIIK